MKSSIAVLCVDSKRQVELNIFQNLQSIFHKCEMKEEKARLLVYLRTEKKKQTLCAVESGCDTALVQTGVSTEQQL